MNNSLFDRLKPKENKFFLLLSDMSKTINTASDLIIECVQKTQREDIVSYFRKIKEQERAADAIQNQIFEELNKTFITPFDREDINHLSSMMDDVIDLINSCAKRMVLYGPKKMPESAVDLARLVKKSTECLALAIDELDSFKKRPAKIREYCDKLSEIEHKADDVYEEFIIDLFNNEKDAIEVIKLKDILHELERATDASRSVGKIIRTIIIKYS